MRILLINEWFPPVAPGGAEWSVYYLSEALAARGHRVAIATVHHGPEPKAPSGVKVYAMPFPFRLAAGQKMYRQGFLENPVFHFLYAVFVWRTARRFQPDLLHSQSKNALVAGTIVSGLTGIPNVYTLRDIGIACPYGMCFINGHDVEGCSFGTCLGSCGQYVVDHYSPRRIWDFIKIRLLAVGLWPDTLLKQWCMRRAAERITPSRGLIQSLPKRLRNGGITWSIIPHLPPSVPPQGAASDRASLNTDPLPSRYILYLGKISPGKGIYVLEEAMRKVSAQHPDVSFVFAGKGSWQPPKDLPIRSLGSVDHEQALDLMKTSACVVVPSIVPEAYNRVVLEAMSLGKPVVASDSGSLPEQIKDQETGLIVPRGSAEALAHALHRMMSEPALAERCGTQGQKWVRQSLSSDQTLKLIEEVYRRVSNRESSARWAPLNAPIRLWLEAIVLFNDKAKRLAMWLVMLTGKSRQRVHPKNLLEDNDNYAWYRPHLRPDERMLDLGCGHGTHTFIAASNSREVVGMDYDSGNLETCRERARERGVRNVSFVSGNAEERLPFEDHAFDTVLMLDVLEHLNQREGTLGEVWRILKPGGRLLVAIPNRETSWKSRLKRAGLFYYSDRDHKIEYSLSEAREELESNHFAIQDPVQTVVIDTPWVGAIDLVGGISLSLYRWLMDWKARAARENPEESIGFQIIAHKL
jgi:glycosyltransferase involved in cell wall biosynthesis/2-polyprenyl-3-methyl-5-hydroxy-6-metoxy-1,4-benzoquinol methylase